MRLNRAHMFIALFTLACGGGETSPMSDVFDAVEIATDTVSPDIISDAISELPHDILQDLLPDPAPDFVTDQQDISLDEPTNEISLDEGEPYDYLAEQAGEVHKETSVCATDDDCLREWGEPPPCRLYVCDQGSHQCEELNTLDGTPCPGDDPCKGLYVCVKGDCTPKGPPISCDDNNPCTNDFCTPGKGCEHSFNSAPCDDGDVCTGPGTCNMGKCTPGKPISCDDNNPCTAESCVQGIGCVYVFVTGLCDDGDACTTGDYCKGGECKSTATVNCSDGNPCTDDLCDPQLGCLHLNNNAPCDDGDACTIGDGCYKGVCMPGLPIDCSDDNPCTVEYCDPIEGCVYSPYDGICDDGDKCTVGDRCIAGACYPGPMISCDDNNPCTADWCNPLTGCEHAPQDGPCDDNDPCTGPDHCWEGRCETLGVTNCDDGNPCTKDSCKPPTGCIHEPLNGGTCDDGNDCTTGDTCVNGICQGTGPECNDNNPCTDDICTPESGCKHVPNTRPCDDNDPCTIADRCEDGVCKPGTPRSCDDGNPCTDDLCGPTGCVHVPNSAPCEDGNKCTFGDKCLQGKCTPGELIDCDDNNPCTNDSCVPSLGCVHINNAGFCDDGNACTLNDKCYNGKCIGGTPRYCDDGNPCTTDSCDPTLGCVHVDNTNACEDGLRCTIGDRCYNGHCMSGPQLDCSDGNPFTIDWCDEEKGCLHQIAPEKCDGLDNDGDGLVDEDLGTTTCGIGACQVTVDNCVNGQPTVCEPLPPSPEVCDGLDNDCDGLIDEDLGTTTCGLGACQVTTPNCVDGKVTQCVPLDAATPEVCDGIDNDCDGVVDNAGADGCTIFYKDMDEDGFGVAQHYKCLCGPSKPYTAEVVGDCDDYDSSVNPEAPELCDLKDNDCDGITDEEDQPLCAQYPGGTNTCVLGQCVFQCLPGLYNINGNLTDGCECSSDADESDNICTTAFVETTKLTDASGGTSVTYNKRLVPVTDEDWFRFEVEDSPDSGTFSAPAIDMFHFKAVLEKPTDGSIGIQVFYGKCDSAALCEGGVTRYDWYPTTPIPNSWNGTACVTENSEKWNCCAKTGCGPLYSPCCESADLCPGQHAYRYCTNDSAVFYVRVFWAKGAPTTCAATEYTLTVSNGKP